MAPEDVGRVGEVYFIVNEAMAMIPKIHIIEDTTVSTEQYHIDLTGAKHRVREADELQSNKSVLSSKSFL